MPRHLAAPLRPRGSHRLPAAGLIACAALAFVLAGCDATATLAPAPGDSSPSTVPSATTRTARPTNAPATGQATESAGDTPTDAPTVEPTDEPSPEPTAEPTPEPSAEPTPSPSPTPGTAAACSGTADNRDFFAALASSVSWDVYCAVLPAGWHVESGSYRLRSGGQLTISYKGPGGARLELREGAFCGSQADCPPAGGQPGSARFGDRDARLTDLGGAHFAVVAQEGAIAWQASATGLDAGELSRLAASFSLVGD